VNCEATSDMQATIIDTINAATSMAIGLAQPSNRMSSEGNPKMLAPIMELMTRAIIVQRPIDRIKGTPAPREGSAQCSTKHQR